MVYITIDQNADEIRIETSLKKGSSIFQIKYPEIMIPVIKGLVEAIIDEWDDPADVEIQVINEDSQTVVWENN